MFKIVSPKGLSPTGVGPTIVLLALPWIAAAIAVTWLWPDVSRFPTRPNAPFVALGVAWLLLGIGFWVLTLRSFLVGFRRGELVTGGTFGWCRNPLYASLALFVLPAVGLIVETWTFFALGAVASLLVALVAPREERDLAQSFGPEWEAYAARTNRLLPMPPSGGWRRRLASILWAAFALVLLYAGALRPQHLGWGATRDERSRALPGDELVQGAQYRSTHAITIHAPPAKVWPWLAQLGWGRGGLYSYEGLENLFGCRMKNAEVIVPEWQAVKPGDLFRMDPRIPPLEIAIVEPAHAFVVRGGPPGSAPQELPSVAWQFVIEPISAGDSRLIVRWQSALPPGFLSELFNKTLLEPIHFVMEERMLRGIKERAERNES